MARTGTLDGDVLVVGAGPVGLFLAAELARRGVSCIIVERARGPSPYSKALAIMPRTMEMFERAGIVEMFEPYVNPVHSVHFLSPKGRAGISFRSLPTRYPYLAIVPQWRTVQLLAQRLSQFGGLVRYGHAFESSVDGTDCIRSSIRTPQRAYEVRTAYVAGCDGVHSTVRLHAGIGFPGRSYARRAVLADLAIRTTIAFDEAAVGITRDHVVTMFPVDGQLRRVVVIAREGANAGCATREWFAHCLLRARLPATPAGDPLWTSAFTVERRVARHMRCGRILLAGDAAHSHSPVGGQGMNLGLEDAYVLAQELQAALRSGSADIHLQSYERRRLPVARAVVRRTDLLLHALANPHPALGTAREWFAPYVLRIPMVRDPVVRRLLTA